MPKSSDIPEQLRPYVQHGVLDLEWKGREDEALGTCPFCNKEKHWAVSQVTGQWRCLVCGGPSAKLGGNVYNFIRQLHQDSAADMDQLEMVAEERRLPLSTLQRWGLTQSLIDREWILPAYGPKNGINNLYRWVPVKGRSILLPTPTIPHCMFGLQFWDDSKPDVWVLEGPWDAMAAEIALQRYGMVSRESGKIIRVGNPAKSMYSMTNIIGLPGCETLLDSWVEMFSGRNVYIPFDSDHPKRWPATHKLAGQLKIVNGSKVIPGYLGMRYVARKLKAVASSILIMNWGNEGYNPYLPDGFDVRDLLTTDVIISNEYKLASQQQDATTT